MSKKLRHRGPDWPGIYAGEKAILAHERLAIVGLNSGAQPLYSQDKKHILAVNGEIYNHKSFVHAMKISTSSRLTLIVRSFLHFTKKWVPTF